MAYAVQATTHYQTYLERPPGADLHPKKVNNLGPMAPRPSRRVDLESSGSSHATGLLAATVSSRRLVVSTRRARMIDRAIHCFYGAGTLHVRLGLFTGLRGLGFRHCHRERIETTLKILPTTVALPITSRSRGKSGEVVPWLAAVRH